MAKTAKTTKKVGAKKSQAKPRKTKAAKKPAARKKAVAKKPAQQKISQKALDREMVSAFHEDKIERDKRIFMWAGVSFFMVLILVVWTFSFQKTLKKINAENSSKNDLDWAEITNDFSQTMSQVKEGLSELKENQSAEDNAAGQLPQNQDLENLEVSKEEIVELKARLKELEKKMEGESEALEPTAVPSDN